MRSVHRRLVQDPQGKRRSLHWEEDCSDCHHTFLEQLGLEISKLSLIQTKCFVFSLDTHTFILNINKGEVNNNKRNNKTACSMSYL